MTKEPNRFKMSPPDQQQWQEMSIDEKRSYYTDEWIEWDKVQKAIAAMTPRQVACGFAEWAGKLGWNLHVEGTHWFKLMFFGESPTATTSELFDKYLDHLKTIEK